MNKHTEQIIISPRITEKGSWVAEQNVYTFDVAPSANKTEIAQAIRTLYKVTPLKVTTARVPGKTRITRGTNRKGTSASGKKAYVFLKKGDKIELI